MESKQSVNSMQGQLNKAGFQAIDAESTLSKAIRMGNPDNTEDKVAALRELHITINLAISAARDIADVLIKRGIGGRELSLAITSLQQAGHWTDDAANELGQKESNQ
jgi:hypothetical protein